MSTDDHIHDPAAIRTAWDDDSDRIIRRVGAALNSGRDKAVVDVVLSETDALRRDLAEAQAFLAQRSEALNRTGAQNDALRATIGRVRALAVEWGHVFYPHQSSDNRWTQAACKVELERALGEDL